MYTIGQVSEMFDLPVSTLRYYDREGLFPDIERRSGIRRFGERELEALYAVARDMTNDRITPCTACRYCTERCPAGLDIPALLALRNEHAFDRSPSGLRADLAELAEQARPSACLGCGACEAVCPQGIAIPALMTELGACLA